MHLSAIEGEKRFPSNGTTRQAKPGNEAVPVPLTAIEGDLPRVTDGNEAASESSTSKRPRLQTNRWRELFRLRYDKATGLEQLSLNEFMEVKRGTRAFSHAVETDLRSGWWSSLLSRELLKNREQQPWKAYLRQQLHDARVIEIGPGDRFGEHYARLRQLGATKYIGVDVQHDPRFPERITSDILPFLAKLPNSSVDVIMAFGVFNEPMSLQFPHYAPPRFFMPARSPALATRAHAEHEYVRRLSREIHRVLKPGGLLFGDGLHSRGFEQDVEQYLLRAGLRWDEAGHAMLAGISLPRYGIRDPFFFRNDKETK